MSEITADYYNDGDVNKYGPITAKAAKISGTGTVSTTAWLITHDELPDELIDSDESTADASGAPTLRISKDTLGINQIPIEIVDFTPASGGSGGGATAEIWLHTTDADADNGEDIYLWWGKSGKTQPAADAQYGSEAVFADYEAAFNAASNPTGSAGDVPDSAGNHDGTSAGSMAALNAGPGSIQSEWPFDGSNDEITFGLFTVGNNLTVEFWGTIPNTSTQYAIIGKHTSGGANQFVLLFESGGGLASIVGASSLRISGSSVTGDAYWCVTAEESGSDTVIKWYKDSVLQVTQTHTGVLIGDVSSGKDWVWGQEWDGGSKSDWFAGSMAAMRLRANVDANAADLFVTQYNTQSDAGAFWDTASAVYEAGPFSTEDHPKYNWTFAGRERTWTVELFSEGFDGEVTTLCAGAEMTGRWGFNTGNFDSRIRAAELRMEVFDPDLVLYNTLSDTSKSEGDFKVKLTDSTGTYTLRMRVRLDEISTLLATGIEQQVTTLYAYCSMAEMENIDAVILSSSTIHNLFRLMLVSSGIGQSIEYYIGHYAENAASSGALLDLQRLNRLDLIFAEEGRKIDSMYDQLRGMLEGFGAVAINGMDGKWHVKHEYSLGEVKVDRGAQSYDFIAGSLSVLATLDQSTKTLTNGIISRDTIRYPVPPVQAVQVERGNGRKFFSVDVVKHGDFEYGWVDANTSEVWETNQGTGISRSTNSDTGVYSGVLASGSNQVTQDLVRMAGGLQDIDIEVALRYALESVNANNTKSGTAFLNLGYFNPETVDLTNGDPGGDWTTDPINGAISLDAGVVTSGSTLVWTTLITTIYGPLPDYDGDLRIRVNSSFAQFRSYFDTFEVRLKRGDDAKMDFRAVSGRYDLNGDLIGSGGVVEQRVQWYNGLLGLDPGNDGARDSVHPMVQVLTTTLGSWIQASQFKSLVGGFTNEEYDDLFNLTAAVRIARQSETSEQIEVEVCDIVPHEMPLVYGNKTYLQQYTEIDFKREITKSVAMEKVSVLDSNPEPTSLYFSTETTVSKLTLSGLAPYTKTAIITSIISGRTIMDLAVDEVGGLIFTLEYTNANSDVKYIKKYNLDGTGGTEIISYLASDSKSANSFDIGRSNQRIIVMEQNTAINGFTINMYDYSGTFIKTVYVQTNSFGFGMGIGISPSEDYLFFHENLQTGSPTRSLIRYNLLDDTWAAVGTPTNSAESSGGTTPNEIIVDNLYPAAGLFAVFGEELIGFPYPDAPSQSTITSSPGSNIMAVDRFNQKLYYSGIGVSPGTQKVREIGYDSSGDQEVHDEGAEITAFNIGYN